MRAAFFDMDHTVLRIDTGLSWMKFLRRQGEVSVADLARALYWTVLYKAAILDIEELATNMARRLTGTSEDEFRAKTALWFNTHVCPMVARSAWQAIERHRSGGDMVVLLTGGSQFAAEELGRCLELDHTLSTRVEIVDGRFTGRLEQMCFGRHKVTTAEKFAGRHGVDLDASVFYSDSYNDKPMLERVGEAVAVNPDARLYGHAPPARVANREVGMTRLAALPGVRTLIELALEEDLGRGDATTASVIGDRSETVAARLVARQDLVVAGIDVAGAVFEAVDPEVAVQPVVNDGDRLAAGELVMTVGGPAAPILEAERTALNFLQRLCGVATLASRYAEVVAGTGTRVVDTRKTTPGWRVLQKAAVVAGGCFNHRFDLGSGILIKDNHIAACGGVAAAVQRAIARAPHPFRIEIEVEDDAQLEEALDAGADVVLLDNMTVDQVRAAATRAHERGVTVEVSGGITLETIRGYAEAGADIVSVGALTHSAPSADLALDF